MNAIVDMKNVAAAQGEDFRSSMEHAVRRVRMAVLALQAVERDSPVPFRLRIQMCGLELGSIADHLDGLCAGGER